MYAWSDQTPSRSAGGTALHLPSEAIARPGARVLVAGPHENGLIRRLVDLGASVTWLIRSFLDATAAVEMFTGDVRVIGGSLAKLPTGEPYDVVIALDGLGRLCSTEGVTLTWAESLDILLGALATDGSLMLSLDNPIGVHRLVQPDAWWADHTEAAWSFAEDVDPTKPNNLAELVERLSASALEPVETFAAFAEPSRPMALVSMDLLADAVPGPRRRALAGIAGEVSRQGWRDQPLIAEPQWLVASAVRNGIGAGIAASWVVVARRGLALDQAATVDDSAGTPGARVIITDQPGADEWGVTFALTPAGEDGWMRRALAPASVKVQGTLRRDPALLNGPVPRGDVLQQVLIDICLRHDHPRLRRLLADYTGWLRDLVDAGEPVAPFATPANVAYNGQHFAVRDASWQELAAWPYDLVLCKALREFAVELLTGGYNHPWPATVDANRLTIILGAISGVEIDVPTIDREIAREVGVRTIVARLDEDGQREFAHKLGEAGATSGAIDVLSFQRLRQAHARQAEEIASIQDKLVWLDKLLASRDHSLHRAQSQVAALNNSISFRVGRAIISPALGVRKLSRAGMKRLRSPRKGMAEEQQPSDN
jgi:hypothetical protein